MNDNQQRFGLKIGALYKIRRALSVSDLLYGPMLKEGLFIMLLEIEKKNDEFYILTFLCGKRVHPVTFHIENLHKITNWIEEI